MTPIKKSILAFAMTAAALAVGSATAQAQEYASGDLVLFFQNPTGTGGTNTIYANLGQASTYRDSSSANILNIINLSSSLTTAFGSGWATETTLHMGVAAYNASASAGDSARTLYIGARRTSAGTAGVVNSSNLPSTLSATTLAAGGGGFNNMMTPVTTTGLTDFTAQVVTTSTSNIDDQNPFLVVPTNLGAAFSSTFAGGVMQATSSTAKPASFGTIGPVANVGFALDLMRFQGVFTGSTPASTYEGSIVLASDGNVSFVAIPEPSTYAMLGLGALLVGYVIRRRRVQS